MAKDSAVRIEIGRSFHQLGTVQEKVRESDLVLLLIMLIFDILLEKY